MREVDLRNLGTSEEEIGKMSPRTRKLTRKIIKNIANISKSEAVFLSQAKKLD